LKQCGGGEKQKKTYVRGDRGPMPHKKISDFFRGRRGPFSIIEGGLNKGKGLKEGTNSRTPGKKGGN